MRRRKNVSKPFVPFHAKSGSGLANPCVADVLAENHKHLIVSLTFSAKITRKESIRCSEIRSQRVKTTNRKNSQSARFAAAFAHPRLVLDSSARKPPTPPKTFVLFNTHRLQINLVQYNIFGNSWMNHSHYKLHKCTIVTVSELAVAKSSSGSSEQFFFFIPLKSFFFFSKGRWPF